MRRVMVVVEGQTEQAVVEEFLNSFFAQGDIFLFARLIGKPGHKGGRKPFTNWLKDIILLLKQEPQTLVTTLCDYYALHPDWPGYKQSQGNTPQQKQHIVCEAMRAEVQQALPHIDHRRFIPYIQVHELETLLFSDPDVMAEVFGVQSLAQEFKDIVAECGCCEAINDSFETSPARRIKKHFAGYQKGKGVTTHAPRILSQTGLPRVRQACPMFATWLDSLTNCP